QQPVRYAPEVDVRKGDFSITACARSDGCAPSPRLREMYTSRDNVQAAGYPAYVFTAPPSTAMVWPVMKSLSAEARNTSVPNRSSGRSSRLMARRWIAGSLVVDTCPGLLVPPLSLSVKPGASVLTQMPCSPSSRDSARVNAMTAPLEVTYGSIWGIPRNAVPDPILMILP